MSISEAKCGGKPGQKRKTGFSGGFYGEISEKERSSTS